MLPTDIMNGISELIQDDGGANYVALHEGLGIVGDITSWILGLLVMIVLIGFPIIVALEVLFINVPVVQSSVLKLMDKSTTVNKIMGICLRDAKRAIYLANTKETGKSVNKIYLLIKIKVLFIAIFIIGIILGPVAVIINTVIKIVKDFVSVIG